MMKVILFSLLAIGLGSCDKALEADDRYTRALQTGDPLFDVSKDVNSQQKHYVQRKEKTGLVFSLKPENDVTYKFKEKQYRLFAFVIDFTEGDAADIEIQFIQYNFNTAPTNIVIKTAISTNPNSKGNHGIDAVIAPEDVLDYLLADSNKRSKSCNMNTKWVADLVSRKKPQFVNIRRGPATLEFVSPPVIISASEYKKLETLKMKMLATYTEQFNKFVVASGKTLIGASRREA